MTETETPPTIPRPFALVLLWVVAIFRYAARNASWATSSASLAEPRAA